MLRCWMLILQLKIRIAFTEFYEFSKCDSIASVVILETESVIYYTGPPELNHKKVYEQNKKTFYTLQEHYPDISEKKNINRFTKKSTKLNTPLFISALC
jgi:hypothetical protein